MVELPRFELKTPGSAKEPNSEKNKKHRKVGEFAKNAAEATQTHPERKKVSKSLFGLNTESAEKVAAAEKKPEPKKDEAKKFSAESSEKLKLKNQQLQQNIQERIAQHDAVIASTSENSVEHVQAKQAKDFEEALQAKAADPDLEADPVIEAEYARQLSTIVLEDAPVPAPEIESTAIEDVIAATEGTVTSPYLVSSTRKNSTRIKPRQQTEALQLKANLTDTDQADSPEASTSEPEQIEMGLGGNQSSDSGGNDSGRSAPSSPRGTEWQQAAALSTQEKAQPRTRRVRKTGAVAAGSALGFLVSKTSSERRARSAEPGDISPTRLEKTQSRLTQRESELKQTIAEKLLGQPAVKQPESSPAPSPESTRPTLENSEPRRTAAEITPLSTAEQSMTALYERTTPPASNMQQEKVQAVNAPERTAPVQKVEQLSTSQLLSTAERLSINGVSVKRLYETNQIDREGLIKIVKESLRGGDITRTFEKVQLGGERQRERAREFRHDDPGLTIQPIDLHSPQLAADQSDQLPNVPDKAALQPLHIPAVDSRQDAHKVSTQIAEKNSAPKVGSLSTDTKLAAAAAISITALIIWAIVG